MNFFHLQQLQKLLLETTKNNSRKMLMQRVKKFKKKSMCIMCIKKVIFVFWKNTKSNVSTMWIFFLEKKQQEHKKKCETNFLNKSVENYIEKKWKEKNIYLVSKKMWEETTTRRIFQLFNSFISFKKKEQFQVNYFDEKT